jgi:phosphorylcholine metabolism protein LicD
MEKLIISVAKALKLEKMISTEKSMAGIVTKQKRFDGKDTNYIYTIASWHKLLVIQKDVIGNGKKLLFEDIEVNAPENPECYLKSQYGEYMILPPEDQRKGHAVLSIRKVEV